MNGNTDNTDNAIFVEEKLSSEEIYSGSVLHITRDRVTVPGGTSYREIVHHPGGVCCAALNERGEVALVTQYRYAYGKAVTELPAGKLEAGEEPFGAVRRELREEIGAEGTNWRFLGDLYPSPGYDNEIIRLYTCDIQSMGETHFDDDERLALEFVPLEDAVRRVADGTLPDSKTQAILLRLAAERGIRVHAENIAYTGDIADKGDIFPAKLCRGDEVRIIAPSRSLPIVKAERASFSLELLQEYGFSVTFSRHCREIERNDSASIKSRVEDLHEAFTDKNVKAVMTCIGGFNVNQLLPHIDYGLIRANPKILFGYSDITALLNAVYAMTGLVTYHAPHFASLGVPQEGGYTQRYFSSCLMSGEPFAVTPSETAGQYTVIREGICEGRIAGGNLCTLNLLQGTPYMPDLRDKVLFLEDDNIMGGYFRYELERNLNSLLQSCGGHVKGIVFGRFDDSCGMDADTVRAMIKDIVSPGIPVVYGVDFGHVFPMISFPIGGTVQLSARGSDADIRIIAH